MPAASNKNLVLAAMVFAVAMTFIDQTIVAIAVPDLERDLSLSQTGAQWIINGYLLALAALFAFGGRLGDVLGRRRMVTIGVIGFAAASACCGLTPTSGIAEAAANPMTPIVTIRRRPSTSPSRPPKANRAASASR